MQPSKSELREPLIGIARLASLSPRIRERAQTQYFALAAQSVLNRMKPSGKGKRSVPFAWTLNPYRGCEFGCKYCYARYTHEFMEMRESADFERKIYAKVGAPELLRTELRRARDQGLPIALGTATDPYQPAEKHLRITRRLLEVFAGFEGVKLSITTKSVLVLRDLDLMKALARKHDFAVHMTVTTTDPQLARRLEPKAPTPAMRLQAVSRLVEANIYTGVNAMPILPGITDSPAALEALVRSSALAGARFVHSSVLFLMPSAMRVFMPFLKAEYPSLFQRYRRLYSRSAYLPDDYRRQITALMDELRTRYGFASFGPKKIETRPRQLPLGFDASMPQAVDAS